MGLLQKVLGHDAVHKHIWFCFQLCACGVWGGAKMSFVWPKTPTFKYHIPPVQYDYRFPPPKTSYVQRIARGRAAGCGVVQMKHGGLL